MAAVSILASDLCSVEAALEGLFRRAKKVAVSNRLKLNLFSLLKEASVIYGKAMVTLDGPSKGTRWYASNLLPKY